jgi:hypothetical protein
MGKRGYLGTLEVQLAWTQGDHVHGMGNVASRLRSVMASLRKWSMEKFGVATKEITVLKAKIVDISSQDHVVNKDEVDRCTKHMEELL